MRIATLNVWGLPEPFAPDVAARMDAIGERIAPLDADLVAFQEVWTADSRRRLVRAGRLAGLAHAFHTDAVLGGSGLLVLSRRPFAATHFDRFTWRGQAEHLAQGEYLGGKGFASLRLATPSGPLTVIATHLHARYSREAPHEYRPHRTAQLVQLSQRALAAGEPLLITGDFNFREPDPEYRIFTGLTGARDLAAALDRRQPTVLRRNPYRGRSRKPDRRIDFVFARDGRGARLRPLSVERVFDGVFEMDGQRASCSNHAGVLAEVALEPDAAAAPPRPDPDALASASRLLLEGRMEALGRRSGSRNWAGLGLGCAALASTGARARPVSRRRLLRASLKGTALLALTPALGFSLLSELFVSQEIRAFDEASARLALLERDLADGIPS